MGIRFDDLSTKAKQQALAKYYSQLTKAAAARNKYGAVKTEAAGIKFDSRKEAGRYEELMLLQAAGQITDLKLQHSFTLQESFMTPVTGERIRAIRYVADFTYLRDGKLIVEDVKSKPTRTKDYMLKKKLLIERHGIKITEI